MLTEDQLAAVLEHVEAPRRIILVGDHRQLPPIEAGRPLVDIARELGPADIAERFPRVATGYAELTVHRRQSASGKDEHGKLRLRDDVLLASWFTGEDPGPGADEIWVRLAQGKVDQHLAVRTWQTEAELKAEMLAALVEHVEAVRHDQDEVGFGCSLGGVESNGAVYFNNHWPEKNRAGAAKSCEAWQILSPVRGKGHGVDELNRFLHERFRQGALRMCQRWGSRTPPPVGAQRIIYGDKVICTGNERRGVLPRGMGQVSNGEIGIVVGQAKFGAAWDKKTPDRIDVEFATQLGTTFKYWPSDFGEDGGVVLELAYALTIHKSQGSQFGFTFVVIPQPCFILGRELLYTALTRQQSKVVLFVQGQPSDLRTYSAPRYSEVARRYTNLFRKPDMLDDGDGLLLEKGLIHRTDRGELVRSISEVVVANALHAEKIDYAYERSLRGADGTERYPDFTVVNRITDQTVFWEHLGMLSSPGYAERWRRKVEWYAMLGLVPNGPENHLGQRLVTSENRLDGAIDSAAIRTRVREVFEGGPS